MKFDEVMKARIEVAINLAGATRPCHRCGHTTFIIIDGFFPLPVNQDDLQQTLGGPSIPCVGLACGKCGVLNQHALGVLLPELVAEERSKQELERKRQEDAQKAGG